MTRVPAPVPMGPPDLDTHRPSGLDRRSLMKLATMAAFGVATAGAGAVVAGPAAAAAPLWPGHDPGYIYLGASNQGDISSTVNRTGPLGLQRTYYRWVDSSREDRNIKADHAARRLPWVSFKPPSSSPGGWDAVASGRHDADIRARARRYAGYSRPVVVTFNHEPHNDATGTPAEFARAWSHLHDVMDSETGLANVVSVPIIGDWVFNPVNKKDEPQDYLTGDILDRCHFLGLDTYQNRSGQGYDIRLGRVLDFLDARGHRDKMVGLGETGATDAFGSPSGAAWWNASWSWAVANRQRVAAVSYFNSLHNNNSGNNWLLWESSSKLEAFRASLASPWATTL